MVIVPAWRLLWSCITGKYRALCIIWQKKNPELYKIRDFGGEGEIWTLATIHSYYSLSRGAPSATWVLLHMVGLHKIAEREGFEPPVPFSITGFQDQRHQPLGHPSARCGWQPHRSALQLYHYRGRLSIPFLKYYRRAWFVCYHSATLSPR